MLQGESGLIDCSSHPGVSLAHRGTFHPPVSGPSPKMHGGMGGGKRSPQPPSPRDGIVLSEGATTGCHIPPALLGPPQGDAPGPIAVGPCHTQLPLGCSRILCCNSRAADQPGLSISESCRRCLAQGCLTHGTWPDAPPQEVTHPTPLPKLPGAPLPCHGDVPLGPIARKVLAGCHSPVQKHRHLASKHWSMRNLPRRAKS